MIDGMGYKEFFAGKKITLMGLGLLGRGIGDAEFLAQCGAILTITDQKTREDLAPSLERLSAYGITYVLGEHRLEDFQHADMVIKAAGVPLGSPYIAAARAAGVPVYMSTALFAKFAQEAGVVLVGVTGTRGKSTVTHMIFHTLRQAGKRAHLGGNVRGLSTLAMINDVQSGDIVVLELDSWQLQGFGDLGISPRIAVFTNLLQDHLNYYGGDMEKYFWDKAQIFLHQRSGDKLVAGPSILSKIQQAQPPVAPLVPPPLPHDWQLKIIGEHNRENAALAAMALRMLGLSDEEIRAGVESFEPIAGRLQKIAAIRNVDVYNDNSATTPDATVAALQALGIGRSVVLIVGGDEKNLDMSRLIHEIPKYCSKVVLFKERGTNRVRDELFALTAQGVEVFEEEGLPATVERAFSAASPGETILYSPAFSSFGKYFANEFDRGDQFVALVRQHEAHAN